MFAFALDRVGMDMLVADISANVPGKLVTFANRFFLSLRLLNLNQADHNESL